ncbi:MAG: hypothetical protein VW362_07610 [Candidatus Nanopelagicales bacterium]
MSSNKPDLDDLRRLEREATPGPWRVGHCDDEACMSVVLVHTGEPPEGRSAYEWAFEHHAQVVALTLYQLPRVVDHGTKKWDENAALIAAARNALPYLLDQAEEAERLRGLLRRMRADPTVQTNEPEWCHRIDRILGGQASPRLGHGPNDCTGRIVPWIAEDGSCRLGERCEACPATWMSAIPEALGEDGGA